MADKIQTTPKSSKKNQNKLLKKFLGAVSNLEDHVQPDWWKYIFNATYIKTDGDVVDDRNITEQEIAMFIDILGLKPEHRILDLCCGHGRHSLCFAENGFSNIEGFDRSHYLIQRARTESRRRGVQIRFKEGDARKLSYAPDTFDFILILGNSFGYFETVHDDLLVLKEVFKALKPGGSLLVDVTDGDYLRNNYKQHSWEWIDKKHFVCRERSLSTDKQRLISREMIFHVEKGGIADQFYAERIYTPETLRELLCKAGFVEVGTHGTVTPDSKRNQDLGMMEKRIIMTARVKKEWTPLKVSKKLAHTSVVVVLGDPKKPDVIKPSGNFDDDDLYTIDQLKEALHRIGRDESYCFSFLTNHSTLITDLMSLKARNKVDLIFNLCDEGFQNDARKELDIPAIMDMLCIPYTGAGPQCLAYCYDKSLIRGVAKEMDIPVPEAFFIKSEDTVFEMSLPFPLIVKPNFGDSSFGITQRCVVNNGEELTSAIFEIREKFGYEKPVLVEEFLTGKDLTVGMIGNLPDAYIFLPIIEEDYSNLPKGLPHICGYEAKWLQDSPYWTCLKSIPARLSEKTEQFIQDCCLKLAERLECQDYTRFDWRLDARGIPKLLEVNPNPGWCWDGHLAKMAKLQDISYGKMLKLIIEAAEIRLNLKA
jgi:D-alanine-D-alanine ligase